MRTSLTWPGRRRREYQPHPNGDYEKMVGQTRNKLRGAASEPSHSLRSTQSRRRRRASGAGEPELEEEPKEEVKRPELPLPTRRGNLPGGAREYSPRRIRNLKTQNCVPVEMVTRTDLLNGRFQFIRAFLEQLWDKAQLLQRRQVSGKGALGIGERNRPRKAPCRSPDSSGTSAPARLGSQWRDPWTLLSLGLEVVSVNLEY